VGYYYHHDQLTSSSVLSDSSGNQKEVNAYYPFGRTQTASPQAGFQVSRRFTGQILDAETGLYYYNARYYDPELGRFIQADTKIPDLSNPQSYNRYSYCLNNPLRYTDPDGHGFWSTVGSFFNAETYKSSGQLMVMHDSFGWRCVEIPVAIGGMAIATADNVLNVVSLGGKGAAEGAGKELIKVAEGLGKEEGEKAIVKAGTKLEERAKELHGVLDPRAQRARTTAVTETEEGVTVVSSSERRLAPAQRAQLRPGEIEGVGEGHAETTGVDAAKKAGLTPTATGASRPICPECAKTLEEQNVKAVSPLK
jgi:RHS repeat-associated protein